MRRMDVGNGWAAHKASATAITNSSVRRGNNYVKKAEKNCRVDLVYETPQFRIDEHRVAWH
jgi:hypothetical protein